MVESAFSGFYFGHRDATYFGSEVWEGPLDYAAADVRSICERLLRLTD